jgi:hypothetical protein
MIDFQSYIGKCIRVTLSGEIQVLGILIDKGLDLLVLYNGEDFLYIPSLHIQRISFQPTDLEEIQRFQQFSSSSEHSNKDALLIPADSSSISLRKTLQHAKGLFTEIFVTSNQTLHGYITHIMNNYFVFYSPVYKTIYIPFQHVKWVIPYPDYQTPYNLTKQELPLQPSTTPLSRTFEEQLKKLIGKMVVFDLGHQQMKVGKLVHIQDNFIELTVARNESIYLHLAHIKTVHCP